MAATTISRPTLTDDTGDLISGDIVNAAFFGTNVYDVVDSIFTLATTQWEGTTNGGRRINLQNLSTGAAAFSAISVGNDVSATRGEVQCFGSSYTTSGTAIADSIRLVANGVGGLTLAAFDAAGVIRLVTAGNERARLLASGHVRLTELSADPSTGDMTTLAHAAIYMKNDKFVIAYNNGGTMTYLSIALNGSSTTWVHNTTAP